MRNYLQYITLNTLRFNFHYFPFSTAIRFPVFVSRQTKLSFRRGEVVLNSVKTGVVKIGFGGVGIFDRSRSRTIWEVAGKVIFHGKCNMGHGSRVSVNKTGVLEFGDKFVISAESAIVCSKHISFGDGCLLSWDILVMDTDFHNIYSSDGTCVNAPAEIIIGDNVWVGCRATIMKGVVIAPGSIIGAGAVITKSCSSSNSIYAGHNKFIKTDVRWEH